MRLLLALLAVLALLTNPVAAAAAQVACSHDDGSVAMSGMDMDAMPGMEQAGTGKGGDPCCDQSGHHGQKRDMACVQACAAMCAVAVSLTAAADDVVFAPRPADVPSARIVSPHPYEPPGLKRPPKSIA
jgi:hypothetical protein